MPLSSVVQRQHHIAALLFQDRKYHHGFHAYLFNFLRVRLTHTVRRYHQRLLCMEKRFLGNPAGLVKIRDQSRCQPFTDDIHRIRVCLQLKNLCAVYLNVLCQNLQPSAHSQFDLIITVQKLDDLRSSLYRMEIAAHLFLRISAPSALGFRAETGHTVSVDICTGIPQQIQNLVKRYGIELLQIIYLPVQNDLILHTDGNCCHMSAIRQLFHHLLLQGSFLYSV